jgi:hypothetical protein
VALGGPAALRHAYFLLFHFRQLDFVAEHKSVGKHEREDFHSGYLNECGLNQTKSLAKARIHG